MPRGKQAGFARTALVVASAGDTSPGHPDSRARATGVQHADAGVHHVEPAQPVIVVGDGAREFYSAQRELRSQRIRIGECRRVHGLTLVTRNQKGVAGLGVAPLNPGEP